MALRRRRPFAPQLVTFEDRVVPASYYVDNAFNGQPNGTIVTFNAGQANQVTNLTVGTDAFAKFSDALTIANGTVGVADQIFFANGTFEVDQAANTKAFLITDSLTFIGSGKTVTTLKSISDTVDASGTNGALFAAQSTTFNVNNLTLDGDGQNGKLTASGFRYENAVGTVTNTVLQNVQDLSGGSSVGYGVVATGTSNVTVSGSFITNNGRGGIRLDAGAQGTIQSNTIQGRGGVSGGTALDVNYGVDITDGSSALVSGNVIKSFSGSNGKLEASAAIQVASSITASPSSALILGNTLDGNATGIIVGIDAVNDASTANIQFNNIINNDASLGDGSGIFTATTGVVNAINNFWGSANGPFNPTTNPGGTNTSSVTDGVTFKDAGITQPPNGIATGILPVQPAATPDDAENGASPSVVSITGPVTGTPAPITLVVTFSEAVSGFTAADVQIGGTAGPGTVTSVSSKDNITWNVIVAGLNRRGNVDAKVVDGGATNNAGLGNLVGAGTIAFQPPFDRGFTVAGDAGIVTPVIGVTDTFVTRFNSSVFGNTFTGGQRVAAADLNNDGTLDYIVASGPGITTQVLAFDGATEKGLFSLQPFGAFTRGALVSGGDVTGDGRAEIIITAERGGGARIRIFTPDANGLFTQLSDFIGIIGGTGIPDVNFRGGGRSAVGDFNGDGRGDLAFAAGTGGGPRIALFNGQTLGLTGGPKLTGDFFVYESTLRNGSFIGAGDVDGDGKADLITGAGNGGTRVRVINGNTLITSNGLTVTAIADFFAFTSNTGSGVRVAAHDIDGDGKADVMAGPGAGAGSTVRIYSATNLIANGLNPGITNQLSLFGAFTGGIYVG